MHSYLLLFGARDAQSTGSATFEQTAATTFAVILLVATAWLAALLEITLVQHQ